MGIQPSQFGKQRLPFSDLKADEITYFYNTTAGVGTTTSTVFVDYPGPREKTIVKRLPTTALFVSGSVGAFKGGGVAGNVYFALKINGVDYNIAQFFFNTLAQHNAVPFTAPIAVGLTPGTYTARLRWRIDVGNANADANDVIQIRFDEGYSG